MTSHKAEYARNGGAPFGLKLLSPIIGGPLPWDVLIFLPLICLGVALAIAGIAVAALDRRGHLTLYGVGGAAIVGGCAAAILFGRNVPRVPDEDDVPRVPIDEPGGYPTAPVPPKRAELSALGSTWFTDNLGRKILFRGINVTGSCKIPMMPQSSINATIANGDDSFDENEANTNNIADSPSAPNPNLPPSEDPFYNYKDATFVGRPFPLSEADTHLARLRAWGFTCFRLLFTWEAVEHSGPGIYDEEYLDYLVQLCRKCNEYDISVFLDSHQDVWSRWSGGDGAPAWTLERVGFDITKLADSGAAYLSRPEDAVTMAWNSNNARLAAGTMWTLFFAGNDFAPKTMVDGEPVQEYLQRHYCDMLSRVAEAVKGEPNVLGFDIMNEPSVGFVGTRDATSIADNQYLIGWRVDVWSAILLGAGYSRMVEFFSSFMVYEGHKTLNKMNVCAWKNGNDACVWRQNGVWDMSKKTGKPELKNKSYFAKRPTGEAIDFQHDYAEPFWYRATDAVRKHMGDAIIFAEPVLDMTDPSASERPKLTNEQVGKRGFVWAKHCYDGITLLTCSFHRWLNMNSVTCTPLIGLSSIQKSFGKTLSGFKKETENMGGGSPVLIGECGIPFKMRRNNEFKDMSPCTCALNNTMRSIEIALVSCTLWNYTAENSNRLGDNWNGEDLSIFSADQHYDKNDLHSGGRGLPAAIRPYAMATAGEPTKMDFDPYRHDKRFIFSFIADTSIQTNQTVVFLPRYQYPRGAVVTLLSGKGSWTIDWKKQTLIYCHDGSSPEHTLVITKAPKDSLLSLSHKSDDTFEDDDDDYSPNFVTELSSRGYI